MITKTSLQDDTQLISLYRGAVARGWIGKGTSDLISYFAAAEHALEVGNNPGHLFSAIVSKQRWELITEEEEGRALDRLRRIKGRIKPAAKNEEEGVISEGLDHIGAMLDGFK